MCARKPRISSTPFCIDSMRKGVFILEYPTYYQGVEIGQVRLAEDGLYYCLSARCAEPGPGFWRLWGCFGPESRCLGVCVPGPDGLSLERRISRRSWPELPAAFVLGREIEGFRPWRGMIEDQELPDALLRENGDGSRTLAIFAPPEGPVPLAERVSDMREAELDGRSCLLLELPLMAK